MSHDHQSVSDSPPSIMKADVEKGIPKSSTEDVLVAQDKSIDLFGKLSVWRKLADYGVELRGVEPVPVEERNDTRYLNVGTWLGASVLCLLP